jgi:hypothetical protein
LKLNVYRLDLQRLLAIMMDDLVLALRLTELATGSADQVVRSRRPLLGIGSLVRISESRRACRLDRDLKLTNGSDEIASCPVLDDGPGSFGLSIEGLVKIAGRKTKPLTPYFHWRSKPERAQPRFSGWATRSRNT